jgi:hypothetical protein
MHIDDQIPILVLHVPEADIPQDAGIVDQNVNASEGLNGSLDDELAVQDVVIIRNGVASGGLDLVDNDIGSLSPSISIVLELDTLRTRTLLLAPSPLKLPPRSFTTTFAPRLPKKVA